MLTVWEGTANILGLEVLRLIKKYQVHELFFKKIHQMLDGSTMDQTWLQPIQKKMKKLQTALQYLQDQDEDAQTYHAKRLANMMTDIYLAAHAIERAETERDETIAKLMIDHLFGDYGLDEDMLPVKKFAEIMKPESKSFVNS